MANTTEMSVISALEIDWPNRSYHIIIWPKVSAFFLNPRFC